MFRNMSLCKHMSTVMHMMSILLHMRSDSQTHIHCYTNLRRMMHRSHSYSLSTVHHMKMSMLSKRSYSFHHRIAQCFVPM